MGESGAQESFSDDEESCPDFTTLVRMKESVTARESLRFRVWGLVYLLAQNQSKPEKQGAYIINT